MFKYKYHPFGSRVFQILAKNSFGKFSEVYKEKVFSLSIDDKVKKGFSHTAILNYNLKSKYITPLYKTIISQNNVTYAGKSREFRLNNPRDFNYFGPHNIDVILVDDLTTTNTTLKEAKAVLKNYNVNVLFCLVLASQHSSWKISFSILYKL